MQATLMLRSRSSGLLPVTHSCHLPRHESRFFRRRPGQAAAAGQRALTYVCLTVLLAGSIYGVTRLGRPSPATVPDDFGLGDGSGLLGAATRQRRQQQRQHHLHAARGAAGDAWREDGTRRAAMESNAADEAHPFLHSADVEAWDAIDSDERRARQLEPAAQARAVQAQQQQQSLEAQHLGALQALDTQAGDGGAGLSPLHPDPEVAAAVAAHIAQQQALPRRQGPSLYAANLSAVDIHGQVLHTGDLLGRVTLIVNVASHCGYTEANYRGLTRLYHRYHEFGLQLLAFPCNQFGGQEPGSHADIEAFVAKFGTKFPLMSKVEVNGASQHPVFAWLKAHTPPEPGHLENEDVGWNFVKFLVDKHGHPVKRYSSDLVYHDLELDIYNELIKQ